MSSPTPEPDGAQPPYAQPQPVPPPYAQSQSPPPYAATSPEQRAIWEKKGTRALAFGALWFIAGLVLTLYTYGQASASDFGGVYVVAWGPMAYGVYRLISGGLLLRKARR